MTSLREKYIAAQNARPRLTREEVQVGIAVLQFMREVPAIIQSATDLMTAGEYIMSGHSALFTRETRINASMLPVRDAQRNLRALAELPAVAELKAYLSDPAVDLGFIFRYSATTQSGVNTHTLQLTLLPDKPFAQSQMRYVSPYGSAELLMTDEDKMAWQARHAPKPKLAAPTQQPGPENL